MTAAENKELVDRFVDEVFNRGNLTRIDEVVASDATIYNLPAQEVAGPAGLKVFVSAWRTSFPDWVSSVEQMVAEGDTVVERFIGRGSHQGELQGIAPTHRQVAVPGVVFYRLSAGKIVEMRALLDVMSLMQQLGVVPPAGTGGAH
jgi:steroid delta-isomerase-like uncharacterized protein